MKLTALVHGDDILLSSISVPNLLSIHLAASEMKLVYTDESDRSYVHSFGAFCAKNSY